MKYGLILLTAVGLVAQQAKQPETPKTEPTKIDAATMPPVMSIEDSYARLRLEYIKDEIALAESAMDAQLKAKYHAENFDIQKTGFADWSFVAKTSAPKSAPTPAPSKK